jgi:hypothetical protein
MVEGSAAYPQAEYILIRADGGGSNGSRRKQWKYELHRLSNEIGIPIRVCHYPPGTSKWNKIEDGLFSFISMNRRGVPLTDYQTIVDLIRNTRTRKGLSVQCQLDSNKYDLGVQITDEQMLQIKLRGTNSTRIGIILCSLRYSICSIYFWESPYNPGLASFFHTEPSTASSLSHGIFPQYIPPIIIYGVHRSVSKWNMLKQPPPIHPLGCGGILSHHTGAVFITL